MGMIRDSLGVTTGETRVHLDKVDGAELVVLGLVLLQLL